MLTDKQLIPFRHAEAIRQESSQFMWWWRDYLEENDDIPEKIQDQVFLLLHEIAKFEHVIDPLRSDFRRLLQ